MREITLSESKFGLCLAIGNSQDKNNNLELQKYWLLMVLFIGGEINFFIKVLVKLA